MPISRDTFPTGAPVDYKRFRSEIRSGDLLLCSGSKAFSRMIQAATRSEWSHVALVMHIESIDRVLVLESVEPLGVRTVTLSKYLENYDNEGNAYPGGLVLARHGGFAQQAGQNPGAMKTFTQKAVDLFGYPYDKDEIARIALRITAKALGLSGQEKKALERDREYICSEYVEECFTAIGISIKFDPEGFVAPADFAADPHVDLLAVLRRKQ